LAPDAPEPMRMMAARGIMPGIKPGDLLVVLAVLSQGSDAHIASVASNTLQNLPAPILTGALASDLPGEVIEILAYAEGSKVEVVEKLLRMPRIGATALCTLAERANEQIGELVATNETLLLKYPEAIEKLYMNKRVRMSTADRLLELAVRHNITLSIPAFEAAAQAIQGELILEATQEPSLDDILFAETDAIAEQTELELTDGELYEVNDEGEESVRKQVVPLYASIHQMTVTQKIRRAVLGTAAERMILVRDGNRLVATAAASSPMLTENDAAKIAASRTVIDDVLRIIARNPEFTSSYQVKLNLVTNPRTPLTFSSRLLPLLRDNDLRSIVKNRNVPNAIRTAVRQHLAKKSVKQ
jgi:hypothetical protein